jgi:hypothetical protein
MSLHVLLFRFRTKHARRQPSQQVNSSKQARLAAPLSYHCCQPPGGPAWRLQVGAVVKLRGHLMASHGRPAVLAS